MEKTIKFKTLMGARNIEFSIDCLRTFIQQSRDTFQLEIFDDGTLTQADQQTIFASLKNTSIVLAHDAKERVLDRLACFPACMEYRNKHVHARKLFDVMLYNQEDLYFIDSDVYFLRSFALPEFNGLPTFLSDKQNAYAFNPLDFFSIEFPIFPKINSGMFYFPWKSFDLEFLEKVMVSMKSRKAVDHVWIEQTLWAFLSGQSPVIQYFDERQVCMSRADFRVDRETVAVHLVTPYRYHYENLKTRGGAANEQRSTIRLKRQTLRLGKYDFALERLSKKIDHQIQSRLIKSSKTTK
jgi:hypothetical protein